MKKTYSTLPESMKNMEMYGFNWMEFVISVPSPLYIMTSYKSNGQPNYQTLHETGEAVINFMSADLYDKCMSTCKNNGFEIDEIKTAGLTSVKAEMVNAPLIDECFMNLECRFRWEKEIVDGDDYVLICLEIVNVHIDEKHMDESNLGRTGETGILYNIHHPINPENFKGTAHDYVGIIKKIRDYSEY